MDGTTHYRNADLDLYSTDDLAPLAAALEARNLTTMRPVARLGDRSWFCGFSWGGGWSDEPEPNVVALLTAIESLDPAARAAWAACSLRVFDLGYDCGREPFAFRQELSPATLARLAAVGATLRITLYAREEPAAGEPDAAPERGGV